MIAHTWRGVGENISTGDEAGEIFGVYTEGIYLFIPSFIHPFVFNWSQVVRKLICLIDPLAAL